MASATESLTTPRLSGPKLWLQALYTIPRVNPSEVDPISRWLILGRVSVVVMSAISAVIGGLLRRATTFSTCRAYPVAWGSSSAHDRLVTTSWTSRQARYAGSPRRRTGPPVHDERNSTASHHVTAPSTVRW